MSKAVVEVSYNPVIYRWEVRYPGRQLPEITHPSKDQAVIFALHLLRGDGSAKLIVYDEENWPESALNVASYRRRNAGPRPRRPVEKGNTLRAR